MDPADPSRPSSLPALTPEGRTVFPAFGLKRWAPFQYERDVHSTFIRLFWGRITMWVVALCLVAWLVVTGGLYAFVKYQRGFSEVRYTHMLLLPWKIDDYRRAKGEFLIREGLALAAKQEWGQAFTLLRTGLLAVPDHREARLMVARVYLMAGRPDMARTALIEGLAYHADQIDYLRDVMGFFFGLGADETVIELTKELRARLDPASVPARLVTTALAYAYFNRDRYAEAERVMAEARLVATPEGRYVSARTLWERDHNEEGLAQLRNLVGQVPENNEFYATLISYLREAKRWGEVRRAALARQFALPEKSESYVDFISACAEEGDETRRSEAEAAFFERFGGDAQALLTLAEDAARGGRVATVVQVADRFRELGRDDGDVSLLLIMAHVVRRDYAAVQAMWVTLRAGVSKWPERQQLILGGLRAVALYGQGEEVGADALVQKLSETRLLPAQNLAALAGQLEQVGRRAEARRVLRHAVEVDPLYQHALVLLLRSFLADNQLDETPVLIERLLGMRKPPVDLMTDFVRVFNSDLYVFYPERERTLAKLKAFIASKRGG